MKRKEKEKENTVFTKKWLAKYFLCVGEACYKEHDKGKKRKKLFAFLVLWPWVKSIPRAEKQDTIYYAVYIGNIRPTSECWESKSQFLKQPLAR